jgi:hypothetical protein
MLLLVVKGRGGGRRRDRTVMGDRVAGSYEVTVVEMLVGDRLDGSL